eukprot:ANDGO_05677.mRNA.1 Alpha-amylase 1
MRLMCVVLVASGVASGLSREEWRNRTVYQALTDRFALSPPSRTSSPPCKDLRGYCGGTFAGLTAMLPYLVELGFDAVWISPVAPQVDDGSAGGYHGYWMQTVDARSVNPHFGSAQDLLTFVTTAHRAGVAVMADVVANHMGPVGTDYGRLDPFSSADYFHPWCEITDWGNQSQVEVCRLASLPDLDQSHPFVRSTLIDWIQQLVVTFGFDGVRIDTVPEVHPDFWSAFAEAAGVFTIGEVFNGDVGYLARYAQEASVLDAVLSYPMFFSLRSVFAQQQSMRQIETTWFRYLQAFPKSLPFLGTFYDNHDNARALGLNPDRTLYKNALAYVLFAEGLPIVYYGSEQAFSGGNDPLNRESLWPHYDPTSEMYLWIQTLNRIRKNRPEDMYGAPQVQRYADDSFYAFSRGMTLVLMTNVGGGQQVQPVNRRITYHPFQIGSTICEILLSAAMNPKLPGSLQQDCITVTSSGFDVSLVNGMPKVYTLA